jgi:hypothetical protein
MLLGRVRVAVAAGLAAALVPMAGAGAAATKQTASRSVASCPVLVLAALPLEVAPILDAAHVDPAPAWVHAGKGYWSGTLEGNRAVIALTGIGMVNAKQVTAAAFDHFGCFSAVVFSGTSGGDYIGDVMVPGRWTGDGQHYLQTSAWALSVLSRALRKPVALMQTTPTGDPACVCQVTGVPSETVPVTVLHKPAVEVGGTGLSNDGFGGRALPCTPQASDILGCWPCRFPDPDAAGQTQDLTTTVPPFLDPSFFLGYESASATPPGSYVSEDNETEAAFTVAGDHHVPFIGFRAASDGGGDPLGLPGYPSQFLVYRQLAADNAGAVALAFLHAWHLASARHAA